MAKTPEEKNQARRDHYLRNKEVIKARVRAYQAANREAISKRNKERRLLNLKEVNQLQRDRYHKNKDRINGRAHQRRLENLEQARAKDRARYQREQGARSLRQSLYYWQDPKKYADAGKAYARKYPDRVKARNKRYRQDNLEGLRAYDRERAKSLSPARQASNYRWRLDNRERLSAGQHKPRIEALRLFGNRCSWCGYCDFPEILEFDHIQSFQKLGVKRPRSMSALVVLRNPSIFDLLCRNCHTIKTNIDKRGKHLSKSMIRYRLKRALLLEEHGSKCAICGYNENVLALQFDHVEPIYGHNRKPAHMEAKKGVHLQLQCANCHALKTIRDMRRLVEAKRKCDRELFLKSLAPIT